MNKTVLMHGLITGFIILIYSIILQVALGDLNTLTASKLQLIEILSLIKYLIIIIGVARGLNKFYEERNKECSFLTIVKQGVFMSILIGSFAGIYELIYIVQHPNYYEKYVELFIEQLKNNGTNEGGLEAARAKLTSQEWLKTPWRTGVYYFVKASLAGIVVTLVLSMFIEAKRKRAAMELEDN